MVPADSNFFPMFPAPGFEQVHDTLSAPIGKLAVTEQVADESPHCDRRYNGFLVSPLPISKLAELRAEENKPDKEQIRIIIDNLRKNRPRISGIDDAPSATDELPLLYEQLISFILDKWKNKPDIWDLEGLEQQIEDILDAWAAFAKYLISI